MQQTEQLFGALTGATSMRSTGTAAEESRPAPFLAPSVASPSPGPVSIVSHQPDTTVLGPRISPADRSMRYRQDAATRIVEPRKQEVIVSERVAAEGTAISVPIVPIMRSTSPVSASIVSASDLSDLHGRSKRRRHHHHRDRSSSRSRSPVRHSKRPEPSKHTWSSERHRKSHRAEKRSHRRAERASSSSSASSVVSRKHHRHKRSSREVEPPSQDVDKDLCGRCAKPRMVDPLDPQIEGLSVRQKERIRLQIIQYILRMKENNPSEKIRLPVRGINDPIVCYRRYVRIARHLYAKRSIPSYQLFVLAFAFIVQMVLSVMFGPSAIEYLTKECEQIGKYNAVFYEMGCRAYSPCGSPQSPEYRFAWQLVTPIMLIAVTYFVTKYTPVPTLAISTFTNLASAYLRNQESTEYRTLLNDEEHDEPDYSSEEDEVSTPHAPSRPRRQREPTMHIPDLESELPEANMGAAALQAMLPTLVNTVTSLRAQPEGSRPADGMGMIGTIMSVVQAVTGGRAQVPKSQPTEAPMYAD